MGIATIIGNLLTDSGAGLGSANGVATLDSGGKIPASQLPNSVMEFKGLWDASSNTPTLVNGTGNAGDVYEVSAAGTVNFGAGAISFSVGDYVLYDGSEWQFSSGQKGNLIGSGTANYLPKFTGANTMGNSAVSDDGTTVTLNSRALSGTSATFSSLVTVNTSTTGLVLNRPAVTNYNGIGYQTNGVQRWFVGLRENLSSDNYIIYNEGLGTDVLTLSNSTGAATFYNNVGIGVTPSAWQSFRGLQVGQVGSFASNDFGSGNIQTFIGQNTYYDNAGFKYIQSGTAAMMRMVLGGEFQWHQTSTSGSANGAISFTQAMTLDSSGRLGIGTSSPANKLDVNGNIGITSGNSAYFYRSANDYYWRIHSDSSNFLRFGTYLSNGTDYGTNPKVILQDDGKVGIGTSSPSVALEVAGASNLSTRIRAAKTSSGTIEIGADRDTFGSPYISAITNSNLDFFTNDTHRMRITSGGNVLIGTTTDNGNKLQVTGAATFTGALTGTTATFLSGSSSTPALIVGGAGGAGSTQQGEIKFGDAGVVYKIQGGQDYSAMNFVISSTNVLSLASNAAATFSSSVTATSATFTTSLTPLVLKGTNASTMWTEYYYNTSTLTGYIGNGSGILSGASASDFIFRSEGDYVVATGGNNRRLTIASTGAATFSSSVTVGTDIQYSSNAGYGILSQNSTRVLAFTNTSVVANVNVDISQATPLLTFNASTTSTPFGVEFRGGGLDGFIKHTPSTGLLNIASGRSAGWGGFITFTTDTSERMRITSGGDVLVGQTSSTFSTANRTVLSVNGTNESLLGLATSGTNKGYLYHNGTDLFSYNIANGAYIFATNNIERARITSGGNVGIGSTSPSKLFTVQSADNTTSTFAAFYPQNGTQGVEIWYGGIQMGGSSASVDLNLASKGASGNMLFSTNAAERMRITSGGKVIVGTNSSNALEVFSDGDTEIGFSYATRGNVYSKIIGDITNASPLGGEIAFQTSTGGTLYERMRITSGGDVGIGITPSYRLSVVNSTASYVTCSENSRNQSGDLNALLLLGNNANNTSSYFLVSSMPSGDKMYIYGNGNIVNVNNSYGTLSDITIKENIIDATPKLSDILNLKVRNFNLKDDDSKLKQIGFIAQEFEEVFPSMVDIDGKSGLKTIKTSVLVPMLVKALQELKGELDELKLKINA